MSSSLQTDVLVQFRHGFYAVSGFIVLIFTALLSQLPRSILDLGVVVPSLLAVNFLITTFFFMGALVLLEKSEGTLNGLLITPLRETEYLIAKAISLTCLATLENLLIVLFAFGLHFHVLPLLLGMLALGALYTLLGFAVIARFNSINEYLLPAGLGVTLLVLPLLGITGLWPTPFFYLHPVQPAISLLRTAYTGVPVYEVAYALLGSILWVGISFAWAKQVFRRHITGDV